MNGKKGVDQTFLSKSINIPIPNKRPSEEIPRSFLCKCGGERIYCKEDGKGGEYYECQDCKRIEHGA